MGPLQSEPGITPRFAQLYVLDPALELTQRFSNMSHPLNKTASDKKIMKRHLETVQEVLHTVNPFVSDFKQILDIPAEDLREGKIAISAKARPQGAHERPLVIFKG